MQFKYLIYQTKYLQKIILTLIIVLVSSCTAEPVDYVDEKDIFSSIEKLNQATLGVYEVWYPEYTIRISSLIADECNIGMQNTGLDAVGQSIFRWTFSSDDDDILDPWKNGYEVIGRVNKILEGIDTVPVNSEEEEQKRMSIKGELLAIRAFVHFDLYRIYGYSGLYDAEALAIPYVKVSKISNQPSRPNTDSFFSDLWSDLKEAEALEPEDFNIRIGITGIECLYARIALYTGKYKEAADYAGKVMDKVSLTSYNDFSLLWNDKKDGEVVFKLKRSNVNVIRPGDLFYNIGSDKILFTPSQKLLDMYDSDTDIRYSSWYDKDIDEDTYIITKYAGLDGIRNLNDVKVFRLSEMYLIRAEAFFIGGKIEMAQKDLNILRMHRISNYEEESFDKPERLLDAIIEERLKELPYEGHRYFDLKRLGRIIKRGINNSEVLKTTSQHYFIPIPQSEVMANPNIRPNNKGW